MSRTVLGARADRAMCGSIFRRALDRLRGVDRPRSVTPFARWAGFEIHDTTSDVDTTRDRAVRAAHRDNYNKVSKIEKLSFRLFVSMFVCRSP